MVKPRYGTPEFREAIRADIHRRLKIARARRQPRPRRPPQTVHVTITRDDGTRWPFLIRVEDRPGWRQRYERCLESAREMVPGIGDPRRSP